MSPDPHAPEPGSAAPQPPASAPPWTADGEPLTVLLDLTDEVLGVRCDPHDNFFDHGDSLAATRLCTLAATRHGWTLTPRDLFAWESFALLAGMMRREAEHRAAAARG